jgi:hypothetical protein
VHFMSIRISIKNSPTKLLCMQPEKILQADIIDILFENWNKLYGAYQLRLQYRVRL